MAIDSFRAPAGSGDVVAGEDVQPWRGVKMPISPPTADEMVGLVDKLANDAKERARLQSELQAAREEINLLRREIVKKHNMEERIAALEEALGFYADTDSYRSRLEARIVSMGTHHASPIDDDSGHRARQALSTDKR